MAAGTENQLPPKASSPQGGQSADRFALA